MHPIFASPGGPGVGRREPRNAGGRTLGRGCAWREPSPNSAFGRDAEVQVQVAWARSDPRGPLISVEQAVLGVPIQARGPAARRSGVAMSGVRRTTSKTPVEAPSVQPGCTGPVGSVKMEMEVVQGRGGPLSWNVGGLFLSGGGNVSASAAGVGSPDSPDGESAKGWKESDGTDSTSIDQLTRTPRTRPGLRPPHSTISNRTLPALSRSLGSPPALRYITVCEFIEIKPVVPRSLPA
jgi:hypothetical protein